MDKSENPVPSEVEGSEESEDQKIRESENSEQDESKESSSSAEATEDKEESDVEEAEAEDSEEDEEEEEISESHSDEVKFKGFNPNEDKDDSLVYDTAEKRKSGMKKFIIWFVILAILALLVGWFATTKIFKGGSSEVKITQELTSPTPQPSPSPLEQKLNRAEWSFEVLNGSGVSGLAKKVADQLIELGYQVIKTGNADKQNYEKSQIFVKDSLKDKVDLVIADIKDIVKIASVAGAIEDSTASARIIIGKD